MFIRALAILALIGFVMSVLVHFSMGWNLNIGFQAQNVHVIGLSVLSGAHMTLCPQIMELVRKEQMDDVLVVVGGIIPDEDITKLKDDGVSEIFPPGTSTEDIVDYVRTNVRQK